jgi:hypothetical protein
LATARGHQEDPRLSPEIDTMGGRAGRCPRVITMAGWIEARCRRRRSSNHSSRLPAALTIAAGAGGTSAPGAGARRAAEETAAGLLPRSRRARPNSTIAGAETATGIAAGATTATAAPEEGALPRLARATGATRTAAAAAHRPAPPRATGPGWTTAIDRRPGTGTAGGSWSFRSRRVLLCVESAGTYCCSLLN